MVRFIIGTIVTAGIFWLFYIVGHFIVPVFGPLTSMPPFGQYLFTAIIGFLFVTMLLMLVAGVGGFIYEVGGCFEPLWKQLTGNDNETPTL